VAGVCIESGRGCPPPIGKLSKNTPVTLCLDFKSSYYVPKSKAKKQAKTDSERQFCYLENQYGLLKSQ
jgi:hypothetical protein